jgi:hypothetical protein
MNIGDFAMCSLFRTVSLVGVIWLGSMLSPSAARAEKPPLVPRLLAVEVQSGFGPAPDWDQPYSVALIAVPNEKFPAGFTFAPNQDYELIKAKLAANLDKPLEDPYVAEMAGFLCNSLNGALAINQDPLHATMGNVEPTTNLVYWVGSVPPPGARAKSGPDGDVVLLGWFGIKPVTALEYPGCTEGDYCGTYRIVTSSATKIVHLAIGWFTK